MSEHHDWKNYFSMYAGHGYLATSGQNGKANIAIYARPHVQDDGLWAFIMNDGRSFSNIKTNSHAVYAFNQGVFEGYRFYLELQTVLSSGDIYKNVITESRKPASVQDSGKTKHVVLFKLVEIRPLIGG